MSRSRPGRQVLLSAACAGVGLVLVVALRDFGALGANARAGFLLGVLLLLIGIAGLVASGRQTVVVDPRSRRITVEHSRRFGKRKRSIPFEVIADVRLGFLGKKSNFVTYYYLSLRLRSGETYVLFPPGRFFPGGSDRATVEGWRRRLQEYLALPAGGG